MVRSKTSAFVDRGKSRAPANVLDRMLCNNPYLVWGGVVHTPPVD